MSDERSEAARAEAERFVDKEFPAHGWSASFRQYAANVYVEGVRWADANPQPTTITQDAWDEAAEHLENRYDHDEAFELRISNPCRKEAIPMSGTEGIRDTSNGRCEAALMIRGGRFQCDYGVAHDGWAHSSKDAEAIWKGGSNE